MVKRPSEHPCYGPRPVLCTPCTYSNLHNSARFLILQMRKLKSREVHSLSKQHWYSKHCCLAPKLASFSLYQTEIKKKKKKGGRRFSVSPEGNYSRKQNVIRVLSKAEVREGTARQSCPGERVLQRDSLGQASLPSRPALGLLGV